MSASWSASKLVYCGFSVCEACIATCKEQCTGPRLHRASKMRSMKVSKFSKPRHKSIIIERKSFNQLHAQTLLGVELFGNCSKENGQKAMTVLAVANRLAKKVLSRL